VRLVLPRPPGRPLILSSFVQPEALRLLELRASAGGAPLQAARFLAGGFERWRIAQPPAGEAVVVEYVVSPGAEEEAKMAGPTGHRFGHLDSGFGLFAGRQIFLFPADPPPPAFRVAFVLPDGWSIVAPWPPDPAAGGDLEGSPAAASFRIEGDAAAARLLRAILGAGVFETSVARGPADAPGFRAHVLAALPAEEKVRSAGRAIALEDFLAKRIGRPGRAYDLILVPRAPNGSYVSVAPALEGFGLSLGDGLATRWLSVGRALGRAYLEDRMAALPAGAPARRILEGLPIYLSAQFAHRDRWRWTHVLMEQFYYDSAGIDLANPVEGLQPIVLEWRAALVLHHLSRALEGTPLGSLESVLLGDGTREAFLDWSPFARRLPADVRVKLDGWLSDAPRPFPFPGEDGSEPPRSLPPPPPIAAGAAGRRLDLYLGGRNLGLLEECGCRSRQTGGMARRAALLRRRLAGPVPAAAVEIGDAVPFDQKSPVLDGQKTADADLALALLDHAGVSGLNVSHAELAYGPGFLKARAARLPRRFRLFSANARIPGLALPPHLTLPPGPPRPDRASVRLIGLVERGNYRLGRSLEHEDATSAFSITDPVEAVRRARAGMRRGETLAAAGYLSPTTVLRLAREFPDLPLVVTHDYFRFNQDPRLKFERPIEGLSTFGMLDGTLVVVLQSDSYGLVRLGLLLRPDGGIAGAELEDLVLDESIPDDPAVRARLDAHYARLARESGLADLPSLGDLLAERLQSNYAGAATCAACHAAETAQWSGTPHASAFATLLERSRQGVPGCFACHVTGYRQPTGYRSIADRGLRNVQCEACHGPGARHVEEPSPGSIVRAPPATVCRECHDPKHSEMTGDNFADYLARVVHAPGGG
jgi:hypothetical protein